MAELKLPRTVALTLKVHDSDSGVEMRARLDQSVNHEVRQCPEVDIRSRRNVGSSNRHRLATARHHERRPAVNDCGVFAVLHASKERVVFERLETLAQVVNIGLAPHET